MNGNFQTSNRFRQNSKTNNPYESLSSLVISSDSLLNFVNFGDSSTLTLEDTDRIASVSPLYGTGNWTASGAARPQLVGGAAVGNNVDRYLQCDSTNPQTQIGNGDFTIFVTALGDGQHGGLIGNRDANNSFQFDLGTLADNDLRGITSNSNNAQDNSGNIDTTAQSLGTKQVVTFRRTGADVNLSFGLSGAVTYNGTTAASIASSSGWFLLRSPVIGFNSASIYNFAIYNRYIADGEAATIISTLSAL